MFIPTIIAFSAVGAILVFKYLIDPSEENIERYALEEVIQGHTADILDLFGSDVKKKISYNVNPIGKVNKAFGYKEFKALEEAENGEFDEEDERYRKDEDDEWLELKNNFFYFKIRPDSFLQSIIAVVTDDVLNMEVHTQYMIVPQNYVKDGEILTIDDRYNPVKMAGVWIPETEKGAEFIKEKTFSDMFEETLETAKEAVRSTNHMNLKFAQNIQELEKQEELIQKRFGSKTAGMVNEN